MAKIGAREQQLRAMRTVTAKPVTRTELDQALAAAQGRGLDAALLGANLPTASAAAEPSKENDVTLTELATAIEAPKPTPKPAPAKPAARKAAKAPEKAKDAKKAAPARKVARAAKKAPAKPAKGNAAAPKGGERSPLAVGTFMAAAGAAGRTMEAICKKFDMDAHPMRTKIFIARHDLGFQVEYDAKRKVYVAKAPK